MHTQLSKYFKGVGAKRLSAVEINPDVSNQHEFNGIAEFKNLFGAERKLFSANFIYLSDIDNQSFEDTGSLTWYDAREQNPQRTEFRFYYSANSVISTASENDLVIIGILNNDSLLVITAQKDSTSEKQLLWLFGLAEVSNKFIVKDLANDKQDIGFAGRYILSSIGIEIPEPDSNFLEIILRKFGPSFPSTSEFSEFARASVNEVSAIDAPDETLISWLEREEACFRSLEKYLVVKRLQQGFGSDGSDVDGFIQFSLSVQNRRKSRAGLAFENHLEEIFIRNGIHYSKGAMTERKNRPDFLFPGIQYYKNTEFDISLLTMLAAKTSAKDRWRQVLSEAVKIKRKHLITLEPAISKDQTDEMEEQNIQLVIPQTLFNTFSDIQIKEFINLFDFITIVKERQKQINFK